MLLYTWSDFLNLSPTSVIWLVNYSCSVALLARLYLCLLSFKTSPILSDFDSQNIFHNDAERRICVSCKFSFYFYLSYMYGSFNLMHNYVQVLDASWYMPDEQRNPVQEYQVLIMYRYVIYLLILYAVELMIFPKWIQSYDNLYLTVWFPFFSLILENFIFLTGCPYSWCIIVWYRWHLRSNY